MNKEAHSLSIQEGLWDRVQGPDSFQRSLPASHERGLSGFKKVDWSFPHSRHRGLTHGLHPWPAKFIPDVPATAISLLSEPGETVLDPFCGSGTAAVEAFVADRGFVASDINPLAVLITEGKCEVPGPDDRLLIAKWAETLSPQAVSEELLSEAPPIPNLSYWFDPPVIAQLVYLLRKIREVGVAPAFLQTVFSSIIVGVSHQESETRYRRVERPTSAEDTLARFRRRLSLALRMAALTSRQVRAGCSLTRTYGNFDARQLPNHLPEGCAGLSVFSPPYPNSFDYHLYHRFRMFWLGMDPIPIKHLEIGAHLRNQPDHLAWLDDMRCVFQGIVHCLTKGGYAVCLVGSGIIRGKRIDSSNLLWEMAPSAGLTPIWRTTRKVPRSRKSFNLADARIAREEVLLFQR